MTGIEENRAKLRSTGFAEVGHFVQPLSDWENYYRPLEAHLAEFCASHADNEHAKVFADAMRREVDVWRECGDSFGYVFYLGKA